MVVKEPWVEEDKFGKVKFAVIQTVSAGGCQGVAMLSPPIRSGVCTPQGAGWARSRFPPRCSTATPPTP